MGQPQQLTPLHAGSNGNSTTFVIPWAVPIVHKSHLLEGVDIDDKRTPTHTPAKEVMARIPDDEP
jgi:hypothetical protein